MKNFTQNVKKIFGNYSRKPILKRIWFFNCYYLRATIFDSKLYTIVNNLLDQLSDPGAIPTGNLPIKK